MDMARRADALQTGYLYHYAFVMLIGVAALVTWYFMLAVEVGAMASWPLLSARHLPAAGGRGVHSV